MRRAGCSGVGVSRRRRGDRAIAHGYWPHSDPDAPDPSPPRGATGGPCPGRCNRAWREAETLREDKGVEHTLLPWLGQPVWCERCVSETRLALADLPGLYDDIHVEAVRGTPPELERTGKGGAPAWPGQAAMLMIDYLVEGILGLEWDLAEHHPAMDGVVPLRGRERRTFHAACQVLGEHLGWLLAEHGEAADPDTSPRAVIVKAHLAAASFCARHRPPRELLPLPCPGCGHLALARVTGPTARQEHCRCGLCGQTLMEDEYRNLTAYEAGRIITARRREERRRARGGT